MLKKVGCGMCRKIIAAKVQDVARREKQGLTAGTRAFIESHSDPTDEQQMLPLWQGGHIAQTVRDAHAWLISVKNVRVAVLRASDWATASASEESAQIAPQCLPASSPQWSPGSVVSLEEAQRSAAVAVCALI
jgi:hypothetical protein